MDERQTLSGDNSSGSGELKILKALDGIRKDFTKTTHYIYTDVIDNDAENVPKSIHICG